MKQLEAMGFPRNQIIDGRVFQVPNLDFPRLINEGVAYGTLSGLNFHDISFTIYPRIYRAGNNSSFIRFGKKSYAHNLTFKTFDLNNSVIIGSFSALSYETIINFMGNSGDHNYKIVTQYGLYSLDWKIDKEFYPPQGECKILIGNDVWIGRGCIFKSTNPNKPLIIGDGAVVASDSVVVKSVPPYAIVGGNPAQIIKYRFEPHVIEALLRIKWWDWDIDKIHDNFKYFNDVEKFISLHDRN